MIVFMYYQCITAYMLTFLLIVFMMVLLVAYERSVAARPYKGKISDHFNGKQFFSTGTGVQIEAQVGQRRSIWVWLFMLSREKWQMRAVTPSVPPERVHEGIRVTFINHATVLIQCDGLNIITDPVWSYRVSPFPFLGPSRYADAGVDFDNLPPIDIVLLSHNHYDHMDLTTLRKIVSKWNPRLYTGLGNAAYLTRKGIHGASDMDWWDETIDRSMEITCVPARHFSSRSLTDRNVTLWCGFVLQTKEGNIYFSGDTGFGSFVRDIAARFSPVKLALIPIGAYDPAWMMQPVHTNPDEAIAMHDILRSAHSIGIHHGTFRLTDEPQDQPRERIEAQKGERDFHALLNGGTVLIKGVFSKSS